ncbi:hypothetical protein [Cupriavidus taiwanensis]|uniref:Uncharacterized protein n=1 Tax=Cupriavidus taiwanensis TaxID=164546 RepID=A0A375JBZ4_9BURK|nr:hypothetical protein [Cupriavidus taiwanensis]SPS02292.1 conserved hypothetical protein [Cupriavidus taiwanensis]
MTLFGVLKRAVATILGQPPVVASRAANEVPVGTGADNEFQILINGVPNLFRDEGDHVVHFVAVFDRSIQHTAFGHKVLPEVVPRWHKLGRHDGESVTPQSVAEAVMRHAKEGASAAPLPQSKGSDESRESRGPRTAQHPRPDLRPAKTEPRYDGNASRSNYTVGKLVEWGEMEFPNRKPGGKATYTSFAVKLDTHAGERTLQGEGLKDALADAACKIGDRVGIKRLHKEKVPAFNHANGRPVLDPETGEQKLWDRWVWQVNRIH